MWYAGAALLFVAGVLLRSKNHQFYEIASKAAELIVLAAGLFSVLLVREQLIAQEEQLNENHQQMVADHKWKTYISYHQLFGGGVPPESVHKPMYALATEHNFIQNFDEMGQEMPEAALRGCIDDIGMRQVIRPYLDEFETFSAAVNAGIVDEEYARTLEGSRVIRNFTVFRALIKHLQRGHPMAYVELEKLANKWAERKAREEDDKRSHSGAGSGTHTRIEGPK
jgi:hypothetical protein